MSTLRLLLVSVLLLALASCAHLPGTPLTLPTTTSSPSAPTTTSTVAPTPTSAGPRPCPVPSGNPPVPGLESALDLGASLLSYFNGGGSADALQAAMEAAHRVPAGSLGISQVDVNADGWLDLAGSTADPHSQANPPGGTLWVLVCSGQGYILGYSLTPPAAGAPVVHNVEDLTGDGSADLLIGLPTCGAHTCFEKADVLVWTGSTLEGRLEGTSEDLPSPAFEVLPAPAPRPAQIEIRGTGIASVGAGPYRPVVRTWSWDAARGWFVVTSDVTLSTNYRIHVLQDADRADREGNYALAQDLYYRVVTDDSLDDWAYGEEGRQNLAAYATFRKVLTYLQMGDLGDAQVAYGILQNGHPSGAIGHSYAEMAQAFWEEYGASGNLAAACTAAQAYAAAHPAEILDPLYYGYANPAYIAQDICPLAP